MRNLNSYAEEIFREYGLVPEDKLFKIELRSRLHLDKLTERGILIDTDALENLIEVRSTEIAEMVEIIRTETNGKITKPNSSKEIGLYLEGEGIEVERTPKGSYKSDQETLGRITHPIIPKVIGYKKKLSSLSQLKSIKGDISPDGRVHPIYHSTTCPTGRIYTEAPNFQGWGDDAKTLIIPDKGYRILQADHKSQELRIVAALANVKGLIKAFNDGRDPHRYVVSLMLGIPEEDVTDEQRHLGKALNFGTIYGQTVEGLARKLNCSVEQAQIDHDRYFSAFPEIRRWVEQVVSYSRKTGITTTMMGRKRVLDYKGTPVSGWDKLDRQAMNTPIQGSAADIIKTVLARIPRDNPKLQILCPIHDALLLQYREDCEESQVREYIEECMRFYLPNGVVLESDWKD